MSVKVHIANGVARPCRVTSGQCPYAGSGYKSVANHYEFASMSAVNQYNHIVAVLKDTFPLQDSNTLALLKKSNNENVVKLSQILSHLTSAKEGDTDILSRQKVGGAPYPPDMVDNLLINAVKPLRSALNAKDIDVAVRETGIDSTLLNQYISSDDGKNYIRYTLHTQGITREGESVTEVLPNRVSSRGEIVTGITLTSPDGSTRQVWVVAPTQYVAQGGVGFEIRENPHDISTQLVPNTADEILDDEKTRHMQVMATIPHREGIQPYRFNSGVFNIYDGWANDIRQGNRVAVNTGFAHIVDNYTKEVSFYLKQTELRLQNYYHSYDVDKEYNEFLSSGFPDSPMEDVSRPPRGRISDYMICATIGAVHDTSRQDKVDFIHACALTYTAQSLKDEMLSENEAKIRRSALGAKSAESKYYFAGAVLHNGYKDSFGSTPDKRTRPLNDFYDVFSKVELDPTEVELLSDDDINNLSKALFLRQAMRYTENPAYRSEATFAQPDTQAEERKARIRELENTTFGVYDEYDEFGNY